MRRARTSKLDVSSGTRRYVKLTLNPHPCQGYLNIHRQRDPKEGTPLLLGRGGGYDTSEGVIGTHGRPRIRKVVLA
jgi:hypothetical protein